MVVAISGLLLISSFCANCEGNEILIKSSVNTSGVIHGCSRSSPESCTYKFQREENYLLNVTIEIVKLQHGGNAESVTCPDTNQLWLDGGAIDCKKFANNSKQCHGYRYTESDCESLCESCSCENNERNVSLEFKNSSTKAAVVMWRYTVNFHYLKCSSAPSTTQTSSAASEVTTMTTTTTTKDKSSEEVTTGNNGNTELNHISTDQGVEKTMESPSSVLITYVIPVAAAIAIIVVIIAIVICIRKKRKSASNEIPLDDAGTNFSEVDVYACVSKGNDGSKATAHYTREIVDNELYGTAP